MSHLLDQILLVLERSFSMKPTFHASVLGVLLVVGVGGLLRGADATNFAPTVLSPTQRVLQQSAAEEKFTFLMFYRDRESASQAMAKTAKEGVAKRSDRASLAFVLVTDDAEKPIVARFDVARAPMPLTIAVAPNGAVTGAFVQRLQDANFDEAIVTPTMARCMKSLQEGKLVFVCAYQTAKPNLPNAVREFQSDPMFRDRIALVSLDLRDPAETRFLDQMRLDPRTTLASTAVLLAPPGVLIGKYDGRATKEQIAAELHQAGKCCEDPNCKHNRGGAAGGQPGNAQPAGARPGARRNGP